MYLVKLLLQIHPLKFRCCLIKGKCAWNAFNANKDKLKCANGISFSRLKLCLSDHNWIGDRSDVVLNQSKKNTIDVALIV